MATFALLGTLSFDTIAKRDAVYTKIDTFLTGKPKWDEATSISKATDYLSGQPSIYLEIRFRSRPDMQGLFDLAKTELNKLTGVTATFSKHVCRHDEGNTPCVIEELATIVR